MSSEKKSKKKKKAKRPASQSPAREEVESDASTSAQEHSDQNKKRKHARVEEHSLNTNVSVLKSLKWTADRAIRELLLNCFDEDPNASVEFRDDGSVCLKNSVSEGSKTLRKKNFGYAANSEKVDERVKSGKFGYGLKDAVVLLTAFRIKYTARSTKASFEAYANGIGNVFVHIDRDKRLEEGVEQTLTIGADCKFNAAELKKLVEIAQGQCIAHRVRHGYADYTTVDVFDSNKKVLGRVYLAPSADDGEYTGSNELFVHNCAFPFSTDEDKRLPLALVYNLYMDKEDIEGRDRVGLPRKWQQAFQTLWAEAPKKVLQRLLEIRQTRRDEFYEFRQNQHFNNVINGYQQLEREKAERLREDARRAQEDVVFAAARHLEAKQKKEALEATVRQREAEGGEASCVVRQRAKDQKRLQQEQAAAAQRVAALQKTAEQKITAAAAVVDSGPVVLVFADDPAPQGAKVTPIIIKSTSHTDWTRGAIPSFEEHKLMAIDRLQPIDRVYTGLFRQLRRLLYVMQLQNKVIIDVHDQSMDALALVALRGTILHVRFDGSKDAVIQAAIVELCSAQMYDGLASCSPAEAVAKLSHLMLQLVPKDPKELAIQSFKAPVSHYLGNLVQTSSGKPFCPLFVADEWDTKRGGISSFNIQLARGLAEELQAGSASVRPVVFVVLVGTDEQTDETREIWKQEAAATGIIIVEASRLRGQYQPCLSSSQFARISHVIGHGQGCRTDVQPPAAQPRQTLADQSHLATGSRPDQGRRISPVPRGRGAQEREHFAEAERTS